MDLLTNSHQATTSRESFLEAVSFLLALTLAILTGGTYLLSLAAFALGFSLTPAMLLAAAIAAVGVLLFLLRGNGTRYQLTAAVLTLLSVAVLAVLSTLAAQPFFDLSGDGQWYHQEAIIQLANGWNPWHETPDVPQTMNTDVWVTSYPKGLWTLAALIYQLTGDIEAGKGLHFVLALMATLLAFPALVVLGVPRWQAAILAVLVVWNTTVIIQLFSYYNDGDVYCITVGFLAAGILYMKRGGGGRFLAVFLLAILGVTAKFLSLFYCAIAVVGLVVLGSLLSGLRARIRLAAPMILGLTIGFIAEPTYVKNFREHGHVLYPVMGDEAILADWMEGGPRDFAQLGRLEDLIFTLFGHPELTFEHTGEVSVKMPFTISENDLLAFKHWPDPTVAGHGVLFGEIFVVGLLLLLVVTERIREPITTAIVGSSVFLVLLSVLAKPYVWYARYNAQLWLFPVIALVLYGSRGQKIRGWLSHGFACLLAVLMLINFLVVARTYVAGQMELTQYVTEQLELARTEAAGRTAYVAFGHLRSNRLRWTKLGIRFQEVADVAALPCAEPKRIDFAHTMYCLEATDSN